MRMPGLFAGGASGAGRAERRTRTEGGLTRRMVLASVVLAVIVGAAFVVLLLAISDIRANERQAHRSENAAVTVNQLSQLLVDLDTGARQYALTRDQAMLQRWSSARSAVPASLAVLMTQVRGRPADEQRVQQLARDQSALVDVTAKVVDSAQHGQPPSTPDASLAAQRFDAVRSDLDTLLTSEQRISADRAAASVGVARRAYYGIAIGIGGSIVLVGLYTWYLSRAIVRPTRQAATMAGRIAEGDFSARLPETGPGEVGTLERVFNTMAFSLERSRDRLAALAEEQSALRRVATLVAQAASPSAVFAAVARESGQLLNADYTAIDRYDADGAEMTTMGTWNYPGEAALPERLSTSGENMAALVWKTGRPARMASYEHASGPMAAAARARGVTSAVGSPIKVEGRLWGVMVAGSVSQDPLPDDAETRLAAFTELVATAIANAEARAELNASRARIVVTADETRRRIERDLHDGAQQQLVSLALRLRAAQSAVPRDLVELASQLDHVVDGLTSALDELREFARGIHPAILGEAGLRPALRTVARRSAVPVELDVRTDERMPEQVEVAAYYVVSEALANAARHAHASRVAVGVEASDGVLHISVDDDGVGGAEYGRGSGLVGLKDRVEALGGRMDMRSERGAGTSIAVELPLAGQNDSARAS
ncbi:MAG TPA: HAMP domain-containing protein [Jatrophihabitantaceae bacterium]